MFIAEGKLVIGELLRSRFEVRSLLLTPLRHSEMAPLLHTSLAPVYVAPQALLNSITGFNLHRGAVASASRGAPLDPGGLLRSARRIAVLEGLNDLENLGSLFRNAAGLGVDGVLLSPGCADPLYRRVVRVSMGHVLHVPFAHLPAWPEALDDICARGFTVVALTPSGDVELDDLTVATDRTAVLVGAEGPGLTPGALARASVRVRITMAPNVDSLNVATAAAIAFHQLRRP